jgi:hypothetical protein
VALADLASRTAGLLLIEFRPASIADAYVEYLAALGGGRRAPTCTGDAALSLEDFENELLIHFHGKASAKPAHPPRAHTRKRERKRMDVRARNDCGLLKTGADGWLQRWSEWARWRRATFCTPRTKSRRLSACVATSQQVRALGSTRSTT